MPATKDTLLQLLQGLCIWQAKKWSRPIRGEEPNDDAYRAYALLSSVWAPLGETELSRIFRRDQELDLFAIGKALYLPPLRHHANFAPVLTMRCQLDRECSGLALRVMMVSANDTDALYGLGYRIERGGNQHAFAHAQLVRDFRVGLQQRKGPPIACPDWLPEREPSFPLPASNSVALIIATLICLYGLNYDEYIDRATVIGFAAFEKPLRSAIGADGP